MDPTLKFGEFTFQSSSGQLWRGGDEVHLTPKAAAVLRELVCQPQAPVPKQLLFDRVWKGVVVTDDALTSCILELRKALGDDPKSPRYIATRHRRGYQFVGALGAGPQQGVAATPAPSQPAIAVLPFGDISQEHDQGYYCDGLAVELIGRLSQVGGLRVVSRTASFQFRQPGADVRSIGSHLGARYLLEGSIRKTRELLRVAVHLVDVETGYQVWSGQFERRPDEVFDVQAEVVDAVVRTLKGVGLSSSERQRLEPMRTGALAYEHYLRGLQSLPQMTEHGLLQGVADFERAIALDPSYGPAYAGLAMVLCVLYEWLGAHDARLQGAEQASRRAIELAPRLAEAHVARGFALSLAGDHAGAVVRFEEAVRLNPHLFEARYYFGRACFAAGDARQASELFLQAAELRREDFQSPILAAQALAMQGLQADADAMNREGARRAERALALNPEDARALSLGAHALLHDGQQGRALEWARRALERYPDDMCALVNAALVHALLGSREVALDLLERAFSRGWGKRDWIEHDPDYDSLRQEPRFQRLLAGLR